QRAFERQLGEVAGEPLARGLTHSGSTFEDEEEGFRKITSGGGWSNESVHALLDELGRGVIGVRDHDAWGSGRRRLDDDQAVPLSAGRKDETERRGQRLLDPLHRDEAGDVDDLLETLPADAAEHLVAIGTVAQDLATEVGDPLARARDRGNERGHPLLGDVPA